MSANTTDEFIVNTLKSATQNSKKRYKMKKYMNPEIEVIELNSTDVITTSPGTEMPKYDEDDGIWEYSISNG